MATISTYSPELKLSGSGHNGWAGEEERNAQGEEPVAFLLLQSGDRPQGLYGYTLKVIPSWDLELCLQIHRDPLNHTFEHDGVVDVDWRGDVMWELGVSDTLAHFSLLFERELKPEEELALKAMLRAWYHRYPVVTAGTFVNGALNLLDGVQEGYDEGTVEAAHQLLFAARRLEDAGTASSGLFTRHAAVWRTVPTPTSYSLGGRLIDSLPGTFRYLEEALGGRVADEVPPAK